MTQVALKQNLTPDHLSEKTSYTTKYDKLSLITLDAEGHARTCSYWYLVQNNYSAHTAFTKLESLQAWMHDRGLKLTEFLPAHGVHSSQKIDGEYFDASHLSYDAFYDLPAIKEVKVMSNGDYTLGRITNTDGRITVHSLNPNKRRRPVFDYSTAQQEQG